jgi:hypothetical protein
VITDDAWGYRMADEADTTFVFINRQGVALPVTGLPPGTYVDALGGSPTTVAPWDAAILVRE